MTSVVEVVELDPVSREIVTNEVFRWDPVKDTFEYSGRSVLMDRIMKEHGFSRDYLLEELNRDLGITILALGGIGFFFNRTLMGKAMTACVIIAGLAPILWSHGTGADVMKRIATPMVGGVVTSTLMELMVYPAIYYLWRCRRLRPARADQHDPRPSAEPCPEITGAPVLQGNIGC
jgi:hypothetical protein